MQIEEIKTINERAGFHFFSPDTMRFFNSRISSKVWIKGEKAYFITSERFDSNYDRMFTVRALDIKTGNIETIGDFNKKTRWEAEKTIKEIMEAEGG